MKTKINYYSSIRHDPPIIIIKRWKHKVRQADYSKHAKGFRIIEYGIVNIVYSFFPYFLSLLIILNKIINLGRTEGQCKTVGVGKNKNHPWKVKGKFKMVERCYKLSFFFLLGKLSYHAFIYTLQTYICFYKVITL